MGHFTGYFKFKRSLNGLGGGPRSPRSGREAVLGWGFGAFLHPFLVRAQNVVANSLPSPDYAQPLPANPKSGGAFGRDKKTLPDRLGKIFVPRVQVPEARRLSVAWDFNPKQTGDPA
ncbi:MAG: hypothetical protein AAFV95_28990, partial [Bacteroidota bacterium]